MGSKTSFHTLITHYDHVMRDKGVLKRVSMMSNALCTKELPDCSKEPRTSCVCWRSLLDTSLMFTPAYNPALSQVLQANLIHSPRG